MKRLLLVWAALACACAGAEPRAKNVILFLGDAGGIATLHAASVRTHGHPQKLFIQQMPYIGLMDTSSANSWVSDSAAGMTAIMTGRKVNNGVVAVENGAPLKTVLEYAEERGLATGVVSNMNMADATPAACYGHADHRKKFGEIFSYVMKPMFGDGVDLVLGPGRKPISEAMQALGVDLDKSLAERGYTVLDQLNSIPKGSRRVVGLAENADFDLAAVVQQAIDILSENPKGFFLMVECDMHTDKVQRGLDRVILMDKIVQQTAARVKGDTLLLATADHSFDLRMPRGKRGVPLRLPGEVEEGAKADIEVFGSHTGEQVLVAAQGPGAERVKGFLVNTDLFGIMMKALGWQ